MWARRLARLLVCSTLVATAAVSCGDGDDSNGTGSNRTTAAASASTAAPASTAVSTAADPTIERIVVPAPSLAGNLLGDPAELEVEVQLPASYDETSERFPVVYFLHGFDERAAVAQVGAALPVLVASGAVPDVIVVAISGRNAFGGSFYVDSPVTGNWAQAVYEDVVGHIDNTYRTIDARESRGIAGFSMGGFGALDLAMRHADVFGAVYALSPGLFDPSGLAESQMFDDPATIETFLDGQRELAGMPPETAAARMRSVMRRNGDVSFATAYGMAFAPDPTRPPYVQYPYTEAQGPVDDATWARWAAGFGGIAEEIPAFLEDLRSLRGILVDYGERDEYTWIPKGCEYYAQQLGANDVPVRLERYDGGHGPVSGRAGDVMWPFFAETLATEN